MIIKRIFWFSLISLLLTLWVGACQIFPPQNIETIVLENYLKYFSLSPNGDYLIYGISNNKGNILLNLSTNQKYKYECRLRWWDDYFMGCYDNHGTFVIDVKTLVKTPLTTIDLTKSPEIDNPEQNNELFVKQLLVNVDLIYRPEWLTNTVYILAPNYQLYPEKNYIIRGLTQVDELLTPYTIINIPGDLPVNRSNERKPSPNGLYYFDTIADGFTIFSADNNKMISEFVDEDMGYLDILGWDSDSSGVYFITYGIGFLTTDLPTEIRKLKIPDD